MNNDGSQPLRAKQALEEMISNMFKQTNNQTNGKSQDLINIKLGRPEPPRAEKPKDIVDYTKTQR